jgi:hypothetical protein
MVVATAAVRLGVVDSLVAEDLSAVAVHLEDGDDISDN